MPTNVSQLDNAVTPLNVANMPLTLSTNWQYLQDSADTIFSQDRQVLALWLNIQINSSSKVQLRMTCSGGNDPNSGVYQDEEYQPVILTPSADILKMQAKIWEFEQDIDQKVVFSIPVVDCVPRMRMQIRVLAAGATPAKVLSAGVSSASNL